MEQTQHGGGKRRKTEDENQWNKLDDAIAETILSQLPTGDIISCQSVCKRWESIILHSSTTFSNSAFQNRPSPLFFRSDPDDLSYLDSTFVYDMEISKVRRISLPCDLSSNLITVIPASYGLVCYKISSKENTNDFSLVVKNPLSRTMSRLLPRFDTNCYDNIVGIAMRASNTNGGGSKRTSMWNYQVFVVYEKLSPEYVMGVKVFSSSSQEEEKGSKWDEFIVQSINAHHEDLNPTPTNSCFDGNHGKVLVGVTGLGDEGQIKLYFLNGTKESLICLDTKEHKLFIYPTYFMDWYFATDLVECGGRVFVVVHHPDKVVIWKINDDYDEKMRSFVTQIMSVPLEFRKHSRYKKTVIKFTTSYGDFIYIWLKRGRKSCLLVANIKNKTWDLISIEYNGYMVQPFIPDFLANV